MKPGKLRIDFDREDDGRWIADIPDLPGAMAYGATQEEAARNAKAIALEVLAYLVREGKELPEPVKLLFVARANGKPSKPSDCMLPFCASAGSRSLSWLSPTARQARLARIHLRFS